MQQIQFDSWVKKTEKNRTFVEKQKILHSLDRTPGDIWQVRLQKFLGCRGYSPKAKSL